MKLDQKSKSEEVDVKVDSNALTSRIPKLDGYKRPNISSSLKTDFSKIEGNLTLEERKNYVENLRQRASISLGKAPILNKERKTTSTEKEEKYSNMSKKHEKHEKHVNFHNNIKIAEKKGYNNEEDYKQRNSNKSHTTQNLPQPYFHKEMENNNINLIHESKKIDNDIIEKTRKMLSNVNNEFDKVKNYNYSNYTTTSNSDKKPSLSIENLHDPYRVRRNKDYTGVSDFQPNRVRAYTGEEDEYTLKTRKRHSSIYAGGSQYKINELYSNNFEQNYGNMQHMDETDHRIKLNNRYSYELKYSNNLAEINEKDSKYYLVTK